MAKKCGEKPSKKEKVFSCDKCGATSKKKKIIYANLLSRFSGFI